MAKRKPTPVITALTYDGGKPFVSGVELIAGREYTITATVNVQTQSVVWKRDGNTVKTDSAAPFDYTWTPTSTGAHTFLVTPYSGISAAGTAGPAVMRIWTLVEPPPPPGPVLTTALVSWSQVANAKGYKVMWGTVAKQYSYTQDVGSNLSYRVPELRPGTTYYFSSKSYNDTQTSDYGNEVAYTPK